MTCHTAIKSGYLPRVFLYVNLLIQVTLWLTYLIWSISVQACLKRPGINGLIEINSGTFGASSFSWLSLQTEVSALYNLKKDYYITSPYISPIYVDDQKRRWRGRFTYGLKIDLNKKYAVSIHSNIVKYLPVDGYSYWIMEATDFFYTHNFVSNSIAIHYKF